MTGSPKPPAPAPQDLDDGPGYSRADSILFQAWLILFLLVICFALVSYLMPFIPSPFGR